MIDPNRPETDPAETKQGARDTAHEAFDEARADTQRRQ
ncbi:hypothetical protein JHFBIEKO_3562 [Methylobacterium mesophilicum]|nr:hypothetical protein JHFBIEKO_3562 [Methylobacterium mesophilicum]